jgi:glucose/arabinose dehydrogenase
VGQPPTGLSCTTSGMRPALKKTMVASGLAKPSEIAGPPDEPDTLWVIEHRNGNLRAVQKGMVVAAPVLSVKVSARGNDEEGFQSITFAPDYNTSKLFYIFYSAATPTSQTTVDEYKKMSATSAMFVRNVYARPDSHQYHNGGSLAFNPKDKNLYISLGDNNADCGPSCAQMASGDYGRILQIPLNPPTPTMTGITAHYGLRNPYRFSFDPMTGDFYIGDVGESGGGSEKEFFLKAGSPKTNFGWGGGTRPPAFDTANSGTPTIGGFVYRGKAIPELCGYYLYGTYNGGPIKAVKMGADGKAADAPASTGIQTAKLSSFGRDGQGEMYFSEYADGTVYKIEKM